MVSNRGTRCGMAHFHRLISNCLRACLVGFVFLISGNAFANVADPWGGVYSSVDQAKQAYCPTGWIPGATTSTSPWGTGYTQYNFPCSTSDGLNTTYHNVVLKPITPTCQSGQVLNPTTNTCQSACNTGSSQFTGSFATLSGGSACIGGCGFNTNMSVCGGYGGNNTCVGTVTTGTGSFCGTTENANLPDPCSSPSAYCCLKQGKSFGTVNGVATCTGPTPTNPVTTTTNSTSTKTGPSGSTTTTTTSTTDSGTGVTKSTTSSTTSGGSNSDGTGSGSTTTESTETKTEDKATFCEENPESTICKDSEFTGACSSAFSCKGDAVQCAIAQDLHKRHCTMFDSKTALSDLGTASANGVAITDESPLSSGNRINIDLGGKLDMSRGLSGTCIPSQTIDVMGKSIKLDTTEFCKWADAFGYLVVAISLIGGVKIIGRGM